MGCATSYRGRLDASIVAHRQDGGLYRLTFYPEALPEHVPAPEPESFGPALSLDDVSQVRRWLVNGGWWRVVELVSESVLRGPEQLAVFMVPETRSIRAGRRGRVGLVAHGSDHDGEYIGPEMDHHDAEVVVGWLRGAIRESDL